MLAVKTYLARALAAEFAVQWATLGVAIFAVFFAWRQIQAARDVSYEAYALGAFQKYNEYRMQYPNLAAGIKNLEEDSEDVKRYGPFLLSLALAGEALLLAYPDSPEWRNTVEGHLSVHCPALRVIFNESDLLTYDRVFRQVFARAASSCP